MRRVSWTFVFRSAAERGFRRLPRDVQARIAAKVRGWEQSSQPLAHAEPLAGPLAALWRFRIGEYRMIVEPDHASKIIAILRVAHRRDVYR